MDAVTCLPPEPLGSRESGSVDWKRWKEEFLTYMEAAGFMQEEKSNEQGNATAKVTDKIKVAILLSLLGEGAQEVYQNFEFVKETDNEDFRAVLQKFEEYFKPQMNVVVERFNFFKVKQRKGESFETFLTKLRTTAAYSDFGDMKDSLIRDRIIMRIRDKGLQKRLLATNNISLETCVTLCRAVELSNRLQGPMQTEVETTSSEKKKQSIWSWWKEDELGEGSANVLWTLVSRM